MPIISIRIDGEEFHALCESKLCVNQDIKLYLVQREGELVLRKLCMTCAIAQIGFPLEEMHQPAKSHQIKGIKIFDSIAELQFFIDWVADRRELNNDDYITVLKTAIAKWHPWRGSNRGTSANKAAARSCSLCGVFLSGDSFYRCYGCPLYFGKNCNGDGHPYRLWALTGDSYYADEIYRTLVYAYEKHIGFINSITPVVQIEV